MYEVFNMLHKIYGLLTAVFFIWAASFASNADYEIEADLRKEQGIILDAQTIMTSDGNIWAFDTAFSEGKAVTVTICGHYTADIKDDTVVRVK